MLVGQHGAGLEAPGFSPAWRIPRTYPLRPRFDNCRNRSGTVSKRAWVGKGKNPYVA